MPNTADLSGNSIYVRDYLLSEVGNPYSECSPLGLSPSFDYSVGRGFLGAALPMGPVA